MAATAVTLNDLEGHSPVAGLLKCNPSNTCAAFYTISTGSVLAPVVCVSRGSCCCLCVSFNNGPCTIDPPINFAKLSQSTAETETLLLPVSVLWHIIAGMWSQSWHLGLEMHQRLVSVSSRQKWQRLGLVLVLAINVSCPRRYFRPNCASHINKMSQISSRYLWQC